MSSPVQAKEKREIRFNKALLGLLVLKWHFSLLNIVLTFGCESGGRCSSYRCQLIELLMKRALSYDFCQISLRIILGYS